MATKIKKIIYWTPRLLAILLILFLTIFSLDVFEPGMTGQQIAVGLFMHNIPSLILAVILLISWKYEIVGGIAFTLAGITHIVFSILRADVEPWYVSLASSLIIDVPALLIGALFLITWFKKTKQSL